MERNLGPGASRDGHSNRMHFIPIRLRPDAAALAYERMRSQIRPTSPLRRPVPLEKSRNTMAEPVVTALLNAASAGQHEAVDQLFPLVYDDLRRRAHAYLAGERTQHTLSTTALVHEAYLHMVDIDRVNWQGRGHFLAVASRAMRRVLVDSARRHRADKRGGGQHIISLDDAPTLSMDRSDEILALDTALEKLSAHTERLALTVELRFFGGLTIAETAEALAVATSTVELDWQKAKAWLYRELQDH